MAAQRLILPDAFADVQFKKRILFRYKTYNDSGALLIFYGARLFLGAKEPSMQRTVQDKDMHQDAGELDLWELADQLYAQWGAILTRLRTRNEALASGGATYSEEEYAALQVLVANMDSLISDIRGERRRKLRKLRHEIVAELRGHGDLDAYQEGKNTNPLGDDEALAFSTAHS